MPAAPSCCRRSAPSSPARSTSPSRCPRGWCPAICAATTRPATPAPGRSEEHTSELQSPCNLVCRLLLEKKKKARLEEPLILTQKDSSQMKADFRLEIQTRGAAAARDRGALRHCPRRMRLATDQSHRQLRY